VLRFHTHVNLEAVARAGNYADSAPLERASSPATPFIVPWYHNPIYLRTIEAVIASHEALSDYLGRH
jgi:hypothetical protein